MIQNFISKTQNYYLIIYILQKKKKGFLFNATKQCEIVSIVLLTCQYSIDSPLRVGSVFLRFILHAIFFFNLIVVDESRVEPQNIFKLSTIYRL
jgi:hypothetical protein